MKKLSYFLNNIIIFLRSLFVNKSRIFLIIFLLIIFTFISIYLYNTFVKNKLNRSHELNKEFINKSASNNKENIKIMMFGTEWCPYCKKAKPEWDKFSKYIQNFNNTNEEYEVVLIYIDCDKDVKTAEKYNITGYPSIKLIKNNEVYDYDAKPQENALIQFLESSI
tara:strand:+ start:2610 stop:3107 length:498 start_codon:yes stop_codon:yes gene_type:complete